MRVSEGNKENSTMPLVGKSSVADAPRKAAPAKDRRALGELPSNSTPGRTGGGKRPSSQGPSEPTKKHKVQHIVAATTATTAATATTTTTTTATTTITANTSTTTATTAIDTTATATPTAATTINATTIPTPKATTTTTTTSTSATAASTAQDEFNFSCTDESFPADLGAWAQRIVRPSCTLTPDEVDELWTRYGRLEDKVWALEHSRENDAVLIDDLRTQLAQHTNTTEPTETRIATETTKTTNTANTTNTPTATTNTNSTSATTTTNTTNAVRLQMRHLLNSREQWKDLMNYRLHVSEIRLQRGMELAVDKMKSMDAHLRASLELLAELDPNLS